MESNPNEPNLDQKIRARLLSDPIKMVGLLMTNDERHVTFAMELCRKYAFTINEILKLCRDRGELFPFEVQECIAKNLKVTE